MVESFMQLDQQPRTPALQTW